MPLYLGANHEIVLSDGSLNKLGDLVGKGELSGFGWMVNGFRKQIISVHNTDYSDSLWKLMSSNGRELTCANDTAFLGPNGKWKVFHHNSKKKNHARYSLPIKTVNYLPVFGTTTVDKIWIKWFITTLVNMSRTDKGFVAIPTFLATLDSISLHCFLSALKEAFPSKWHKDLSITHIDYIDQQRLFHLFDRTISASCIPKGFSRITFKNKKHNLCWATRTAKTSYYSLLGKNKGMATAPIRKDKIKLYHLAEDDVPIRIESKFGNIVEKNFICQTK